MAELGTGTKQVPSALHIDAGAVTAIDEAQGWAVCCLAMVEKT